MCCISDGERDESEKKERGEREENREECGDVALTLFVGLDLEDGSEITG